MCVLCGEGIVFHVSNSMNKIKSFLQLSLELLTQAYAMNQYKENLTRVPYRYFTRSVQKGQRRKQSVEGKVIGLLNRHPISHRLCCNLATFYLRSFKPL